jgi:hypothetical protein
MLLQLEIGGDLLASALGATLGRALRRCFVGVLPASIAGEDSLLERVTIEGKPFNSATCMRILRTVLTRPVPTSE